MLSYDWYYLCSLSVFHAPKVSLLRYSIICTKDLLNIPKEELLIQFSLKLPLLNLSFLTTVLSISTILLIPPNDRCKLLIFIAFISRQYSYQWTTEASVTYAKVATSVTCDLIIQYATIIIICLSVHRYWAKKVPILADVFLQHILHRNTKSSR